MAARRTGQAEQRTAAQQQLQYWSSRHCLTIMTDEEWYAHTGQGQRLSSSAAHSRPAQRPNSEQPLLPRGGGGAGLQVTRAMKVAGAVCASPTRQLWYNQKAASAVGRQLAEGW